MLMNLVRHLQKNSTIELQMGHVWTEKLNFRNLITSSLYRSNFNSSVKLGSTRRRGHKQLNNGVDQMCLKIRIQSSDWLAQSFIQIVWIHNCGKYAYNRYLVRSENTPSFPKREFTTKGAIFE